MNTRTSFVALLLVLLMGSLTLHAQDTVHTYPQLPNPEGAPPPDFIPVDREPQIVKQAIPAYPPLAIKSHIEGRVIVKVWVGADGEPKQAVILKSDGDIFDQPVVDAAMKYRFTPAILHDKPVAVWVVIPFTFKLKEDSVRDSKNSELGPPPGNVPSADEYSKALESAFTEYNLAMYYERAREYEKTMKAYRDFLDHLKKTKVKPEEMVRHAKLMIQKYEEMLKKGK